MIASFRISDAEYRLLKEAADKEKISLSGYIRKIIVSGLRDGPEVFISEADTKIKNKKEI